MAPPIPADRSAPLRLADGTVEAIKWLAMVLMTADHVNKYLLAESQPALFDLGRIAMPLFVFVLAYNLARRGALSSAVFHRTAKRLAIFGVVASVPYIALGAVLGGWWPLNILFTLLAATVIIGLVELGGAARIALAIAVFVLAGALVEFWWPALALALASWQYSKRPSHRNLATLALCLAALWLINRNLWTLAALPIILAAPRVRLAVPRIPFFFYGYYPAHFAALWVVSKFWH